MIWPAALAALAVATAPPTPSSAAPASDTAASEAFAPDTSPDPNLTDPLYDGAPGSSVETVYHSVEARQGSLDGRWRLSDGLGAPLYDFMFSDPVPSNLDPPTLQGAWRDLSRRGAIDDIGVLEIVRRRGLRLTIIFDEPRLGARIMTLEQAPSGCWMGEAVLDGAPRPVFLDRLE